MTQVPGKLCGWTHLTYCCWLHSAGAGAANPVPDPDYTSGALPPTAPMPADLPAVTTPGWPSSAYQLTAHAASGIVITAGTETGVLTGTTTLLQAASSTYGAVSVPAMTVLDTPFREWRGLQLDLHGTPYHTIGLLKTYIKLARFYKLNILTFNLGPSLWISPAMASTALMNASWKAKAPLDACYDGFCDFYSEADIAELIRCSLRPTFHLCCLNFPQFTVIGLTWFCSGEFFIFVTSIYPQLTVLLG